MNEISSSDKSNARYAAAGASALKADASGRDKDKIAADRALPAALGRLQLALCNIEVNQRLIEERLEPVLDLGGCEADGKSQLPASSRPLLVDILDALTERLCGLAVKQEDMLARLHV